MEQLTLDLSFEPEQWSAEWWQGYKECSGHSRLGLPRHDSVRSKFSKHCRREDGLQNMCIDCWKEAGELDFNERRMTRNAESLRRANDAYNSRLADAVTDGWRKDKNAIRERDNHHCYLCDEDILPGEGQFDHIIPLPESKDDRSTNVRYVHEACNLSKSGMTLQEAVKRGKFDAEVFERAKL